MRLILDWLVIAGALILGIVVWWVLAVTDLSIWNITCKPTVLSIASS